MYLRDTRARIVRPNNMPGLRAANDGIVRLAGEYLRRYALKNRTQAVPANILSSLSLFLSLCFSAVAATEFARASDDRLLLYIADLYLVPQLMMLFDCARFYD